MANKYDIIHIDFQASARGANAAIESIRTEAQKTSDKITALKKSIEEGVAAKMDQHSLDGMRAELKSYEKRYKQLSQAQNELIKGMRVLDEGVKQFNSGALSQMNAAFQKSVNNAAKLAQSKMTTGTKEWREMGAIMQETEQNYARMQRDTDQLIENLQNGGTVFRKTLEDEKKGLNDLLQVLPYMGTEYRKAEEQLQILVKTTDEMITKERQLKGEIVTANDARRVRMQLTKEGAEAARQAADAAQVEIDKGKQQIEILEKQQAEIEARAKASAEAAAKYTEDLQMYDDYIEELDREIDKDKKAAKQRKEKAEDLRKEADEAKKNAEAQREAQKIVDQAVETSAAKVENLKQQLKDLKSGQQQAADSAKESAGAKKEDAAATEQQAEAAKKKTEAKKEEVKVEEQVVETQKTENVTVEQLTAAIDQQKAELEKLEAEKKAIIAAQEESAKATNAEAEAYKNLTKEQAEAKLKEKQALATFKNEGGKWQVTNREEAQQFIFDALGEIEPSYVGKTKIDGIAEQSTQLMSKFKERYGMKSEDEAMGAIRELMSGGGLIKQGGINKFFVAVEQDTKKVDAYRNEIKALTDIVKGEAKAVEENTEKKRTLEEVEAEIAAVEKQKSATVKQLRALREGDIKITDEGTKKTGEETEAKKKNVEATNAEIEAIKKLSKEKAQAMKAEMTNPSKVGYKGGKLDASNIEEVQSFIVSRMKKIESRNKKGDVLSLGGDQVDKLVKDFQERYGFVGEPKKAKDLLKQIVSAGGGLFKGGGQADFSQFGSFIVNLDSDAYEARLAKLKELVKITSDTTQATDKLGEATKKGAEASKESAKATGDQSAAINEQIEKVNQRYEAYQAKEKEYNEKMAELEKKRKAKSNLPKSGADALLKRSQLDDEIKDYNENVVAPVRRERNKMKNLWESSAQKLAEMQGLEQEAPKRTRRKAKATEDDTKAVEENTKATENNTKAKKDNAKASQEEAEKKAKEAEIKKQLADAEKELTDAQKKQKEEQSKTTKLDREAENLQNKAQKAEGEVGGKAEEYLQEQNKMKQEREQLMADNKNTLKDNETNQKQLADINEKLKEQTDRIRENEQIKAQANTQGIEKTEQAIRLLQEENRRIDTNSDKWKENTKDIQALQEALDEMKQKPVLQMMTERMERLPELSDAAFKETKKFWEAMEAGADKSSEKFKEAQENVKKLVEQERQRIEESRVKEADKLLDKGYLNMSEEEIRKSITAAREYQQTLKPNEDHYKTISNLIAEAENHLKNFGEEALRTARKQAESDLLMESQLSKGSSLTENALKAQVQYWQRLADDPKTAAESVKLYVANMEKAQDLLDKRSEATMRDRAARLGNMDAYSVGEIREGIEAAKKLQETYKLSEDEVANLSKQIVDAETRIAKVGVEAERQAQKQRESIQLMESQLSKGSSLTENALKAQVQYWQRLADDPKTAAEKVKLYVANMEKAQDLLDKRSEATMRDRAARLGNMDAYSVGEIREGIEAAKKLQETYKLSEDEVANLSKQIVDAETRIAKVGVEAERQAQKQRESIQLMKSQLEQGTDLSESALKAQQQYWQRLIDDPKTAAESLEAYKKELEKVQEIQRQQEDATRNERAGRIGPASNLGDYSESEIREAIEATKQLMQAVNTSDEKYKQYGQSIATAEEYLRKYGLEAQRAALREEAAIAEQIKKEEELRNMMKLRLKDLSTLSASALEETKKYWDAQYNGATKGSKAMIEAERALRDIANIEKRQSSVRAAGILDNTGRYGVADIKSAIQDMERLRDSVTHGGLEWTKYNRYVEQGKKYLDDLAHTDALQKMNTNMQNLTTLSSAALSETKKFWETMAAGASKGSAELKTAEANLKAITDLEKERANIANRDKADVLLYGTLQNYSEREIREAIEAAKAFRNELATGDKEAERYAEAIAKAEAHVKKYGVETARAAQKQKENDDLMRTQLTRMWNDMYTGAAMPSESQLKAQKQYWQRLIDDPKTAASSLTEYRNALIDIEKMEADMVKIGGQTALAWFGQSGDKNASENQIKEMAAKLKEYRGTLLKETNADELAQIDAILQKVGQSAKKAAEDVMSLDDALELAEGAGKDGFLASPQQIQQATKALNDRRDAVIKLIQENKTLGLSTEAEEDELADLTKKLRDLKFEQDNYNMSQEKMRLLMETPTKAVNLEELREAIKRADAELKRMEGSLGDNSDEYKNFAKQVKEAKNVLKDMEGQAKATSSVWEKAWSRLKTYVGMYMGFNMAWQRLTGTFGDMMELSDKMGEVRKTTGFTADEVGRLSENLKKLDVRTPLTELMTISAKAGQLGLKSEQDVMGFTEAANKLMIALPEMGAEAATEMMKVAIATGEVKKMEDQLNKGVVDGSSATEVALSKIGSTIDQLRANSAAAAPAITDFVKRVGAVGAQSGITIDQVAALGATVDALGMRVEMSATALSRMIPAIRNNAFQVANAIGMAPNALRAMFDEAGGGMEAMLAIFQHIKDAGMDPDSIETLLGMGGLKDVMKELNQQGARAGIVFAGLSQNVDELRRNLVTARDAYEDNIAILQEYNKMNDTTAAKWERFKNQIEETFVGDTAQRWLGHLVDAMRTFLDLFTGNHGIAAAFRTIIVYIGLVKANLIGLVTSTKAWSLNLSKIAVTLGFIDKETKKIQWGNIFTALAAAALWAWHEISMLKSALDKAEESLGKTKEEIGHAIERFEGYWARLEATSEALNKARTSHDKLSAEVDKLRKSTDGSAESTANLKKKEDELEKSEIKVAKASNDHKSAISQMNSIYGKYLGFILTETNYTNLAAAAHEKVAAAIEREMLVKQRQAAIGEVDSNYSQEIATDYGDLNEKLVQYGKLDRRDAARAMSEMQKFMRENLKYDAGSNKTIVSKAVTDQLKRNGFDVSNADANEIAALWFDQYLEKNYHLSAKKRSGITGVERRSDLDKGWGTVSSWTNFRGDYADTYARRERDRGAVSTVYNVDITASEEREGAAAGDLLKRLEKSAQDAKKTILNKSTNEVDRNKAYGELANALEGLENRINELDPKQDAATIDRLNSMATALKGEGIDIKKLKKAREKIHQTLFERATFNEEDIKNLDTTNPWGSSHEASSTDWKNMTAEQLVNRRKQMNEFVKAIQTDSDVQSVLGEDAALKAAIEKGMSSDMRTVINWYNTERLKIQDELHARYLTNTGDWKDPKQSRARRKRLQDDMRAFLEELDAYYTERKSRIDEARNDEEISEAEAWNRNIKNEAEWHRRRAELQIMYSKRAKEITEEEQNAIAEIIAERTGDDAEFIKKTIEKTVKFSEAIKAMNDQGAKEYRKFQGDLDLGSEKDYNKVEKALGKHLKAMEDIINKERPFNGIVDNLQDNLGKMGILTADLGDDAKSAADELVRLTFLMGEAEKAYTLTVDQLLEDMRQHGFKEWADAISKDPNMQQGLLAMLRQTFDSVQDAIKKESGIIKKHVENMLLDVTEAAQAEDTRLQILQNSVSRANSLIGAGAASERVADKLAIKQIQLQITLQETRIRMLQKRGADAEKMLRQEAVLLREQGKLEEAKQKEMDADNIKKSVGLTLTKEQVELDKQRISLSEKLEESQNRLYTSLREWGNLLSSSVQSLMEATHAGDAEYYNELAKLNLTGKGGPGAGTYIVIDDEGTEDARAHYEYLDERAALERQREIEQQNAQAEAWKKLMDDLNNKMNEQITDWMNAALQNQALEDNTAAVNSEITALTSNTAAVNNLASTIMASDIARRGSEAAYKEGGNGQVINGGNMGVDENGVPNALKEPEAAPQQEGYGLDWQQTSQPEQNTWAPPMALPESDIENIVQPWKAMADASDGATKTIKDNNKTAMVSTQSAFAKMTQAANLYGIAYQAMSNDNMSATQKFEMIAIQAAGQAAITSLTASGVKMVGDTAVQTPSVLSKIMSELGPIAGPIAFGAFTALLGGLMGLATSKLSKSKSQIAQITGASVGAGRLSTGMLTYAKGNVNEFSDPASLTPGRSYNVDAADGKTYRAKYTGKNPSTHITNGPEFHLAGEKGREMIIDAGTTRQITMNENEIWQAIKTLSGGGRVQSRRSMRRGVRAFAEGNVDEFDSVVKDDLTTDLGFDPVAMKDSLDKNNELLERALADGIKGVFNVYGPDGLVASYDKGKKETNRHGERY